MENAENKDATPPAGGDAAPAKRFDPLIAMTERRAKETADAKNYNVLEISKELWKANAMLEGVTKERNKFEKELGIVTKERDDALARVAELEKEIKKLKK
jgi:seryl-tRNA synthetase